MEAIGRTIETNAQGTELISAFFRLKQRLSAKYKKPDWDQDSLAIGSTLIRPDDWMAGLLKKDGFLVAAWALAGPYDDDVAGIVIATKALDRYHGFLTLKYEFRCYEQVEDELGSDARTVRDSSQWMPVPPPLSS